MADLIDTTQKDRDQSQLEVDDYQQLFVQSGKIQDYETNTSTSKKRKLQHSGDQHRGYFVCSILRMLK
jgi:hypothetical protein